MPIISNFPSGSGGSGGGGLALGACTSISTLSASGKVYIKWTDPEDLVVAGSTLAAWSGTLLVRKAGSMPVSRRDGTTVLDNKTRNAYQNDYFCDSGLTDGTEYFYKFFPYTTSNTYTESDDNGFSATPDGVPMGNVSAMSAAPAGNGKLAIKWTDPAATIVTDGITLSTWASTKVVVKEGAYATDPDDADAAYSYTSTTRNAHATTALTATGLTNGVTYYVSFFPVSADGAVNTDAANRVTGEANRMTIAAVPSQSGTLTYDGTAQSPSWSGYDATKMTLAVTAQTNAGTYTADITPLDDYMWDDGSITAQTVNWTIGKAAGSLSISPTSITLNADNLTATIAVTRAGDGAVSAVSNATGVATAAVSGTTVTVSHVNETTGIATITVSVAEGTNHLAPASVTCAVTAQFLPDKKTLENTTWAELSQISKAGKVSEYMSSTGTGGLWAIGDTKSMTFNGTTYYVQLIGTNHDTPSDAAAYGQSKAGLTFQFGVANDSAKAGMFATMYRMNASNTNSGGWTSCEMRSTTMSTMKGYMPTDLQSVLVAVNKLTSAGAQSTTINTTSDALWLLSEIEIFGSTSYSVAGEGTQYAFYSAGNSRVRYNASGSTNYWWERSPFASNSTNFCRVNYGGTANNFNASSTYGVSFGFCI